MHSKFEDILEAHTELKTKHYKDPDRKLAELLLMAAADVDPTSTPPTAKDIDQAVDAAMLALLKVKSLVTHANFLEDLMNREPKISAEIASVDALHNKTRGELEIFANEADFEPKYLQYMLEHLDLPKTTKVVFKGPKEVN